MTLGTTVLTPHSNGSVSVNSSDPLSQPVIDLQMLTSEWEIWTMRNSLKMIQTWAAADAWDGRMLSAQQNFTTDDELDEWAREQSRMANHPVGGAQMSPVGADWGVTDPNTAVKGAQDLWVIDSSIFPLCPGAHTMAPTYIIAERGVDFVKEAYNL
jgi:choline dehydrogenase-like flavoprotein